METIFGEAKDFASALPEFLKRLFVNVQADSVFSNKFAETKPSLIIHDVKLSL